MQPTTPTLADDLRRALLIRPATVTVATALVVTAVFTVLTARHAGAAGSALAGAALVLVASGLTALVAVRTAAARPESVFAAALGSYTLKVLIFGIVLGTLGRHDAVQRLPFTIAVVTSVTAWLATEVFCVSRLRASGAAVFGPPRPVAGPVAAAPTDVGIPPADPTGEVDGAAATEQLPAGGGPVTVDTAEHVR